jgi:hypothetical protein
MGPGSALAAKAAVALAALMTPAGGYHGHYVQGHPGQFRVGAAIESFTPPAQGKLANDPADCVHSAAFNGPRPFAFEEPYIDLQHDGHYDPGDPFVACDTTGRWEGDLLGGGGNTPRFFDHIADPVTARAMVVSNGKRTIAVEVVDQEGLFNVYQARIRADVAAAGYHLDGIFISATHDESAPDSLGLGGVNEFTSGVNNFWVDYLVSQSALAIERAYKAMKPATVRYTQVLEPSNVRQCWSSYPFVDDQEIPVLEAVSRKTGKAIVTLASVSQHDETLGFNGGTPALDAQEDWVSSDWINFFRNSVQKRLGGIAIEMAGSVGSNESPEVYSRSISRTPQEFVDASHPAGCRTEFKVGSGTDFAGTEHVPLGYLGETRAFGQDIAKVVLSALTSGEYHVSTTNTIWGARANICIPLQNVLFLAGAALGVFAQRPGYNSDCTVAAPLAPNGSSTAQALQSQVAAFQIGEGEFISIPGEAFPFTFLRGFLGPQDLPTPSDPLPPWPIPYMHAPFRFIDGLAEDMLGYIFPEGNAVGIPTAQNPNPSGTDRFGCGHSDDSESTSADAGNIIGTELVSLLGVHSGSPETVLDGRYLLPGHKLSRDPLGGPEIKCDIDTVFHPSGPAKAVELSNGKVVRPRIWMSLSGLPQRVPDRDTRGYFTPSGQRVWLDVFPDAK